MTAAEAYDAMLRHHKRLVEELTGRAAAVCGMVVAGLPYTASVTDLSAYLAGEVLPHAVAEETTIYPAAAKAGLAGVVEEMLAEHATLSAAAAWLPGVTGGEAAAAEAREIAALFTEHAARENDVLLPALLAGESADLAALLGQMHDTQG